MLSFPRHKMISNRSGPDQRPGQDSSKHESNKLVLYRALKTASFGNQNYQKILKDNLSKVHIANKMLNPRYTKYISLLHFKQLICNPFLCKKKVICKNLEKNIC